MTVWIYRATHDDRPRPVIVIGAAGTPLFWGMALADSDRPEHTPWAQHGYVVIAYSLDGPVPDAADDAEVAAGARAFLAAHAGLDNAQAALGFALEHEPGLDPTRIYAVGHSSAATLALRFGAEDTRVKGIVAFNAITDIHERVPEHMLEVLTRIIPHARETLEASSPMSHVGQLREKPVFLFHSTEDQNVSADESRHLADAMAPAHPASRLELVSHGDHYESMIEHGIPLAMEWLDRLAGLPSSTDRDGG